MRDKMESGRLGFFKNLVGPEKAEEILDDVDKAHAMLDKLGVERKQQKGRDLINQIISKQLADTDVEAVASVVAERVLGKLAEAGLIADEAEAELAMVAAEEAVAEVVAEVTEGGEEEMQDEEADETDEEEKQYRELVKSLASHVIESVKDQSALVTALNEQSKKLDGLLPLVERVAALEAVVSMRPRQASRSPDTAFEHEGIENEVRKSITEPETDALSRMFPMARNGQK